MKTVYDAFNGSKFMLMTEACSGYSLGTSWVGPRHGEWSYGYTTSHDILWQLRNRASGWVYWNLMLDEIGGPNLAGNYVDSPSYRINSTSFALNPSYFHMAHFSRYVVPGSVAVYFGVFFCVCFLCPYLLKIFAGTSGCSVWSTQTGVLSIRSIQKT